MPARPPPRWYVISLRPAGDHAALRRAAARHGAGVLALSPWRIEACDDEATRTALRTALASGIAVFTSPAAVRAAATLALLHARGRVAYAVGSGTAAALRRAGVPAPRAPGRMDSEGLLALPGLRNLDGHEVALVTAPGGRDRIAPALRARGARVQRVDVYARRPIALAARQVERLRSLDAPAVLALSSGEALARVMDALPPDAARRLRGCAVTAASERLAALARGHGFPAARVSVAAGPRPAQLVDAAAGITASGIAARR
ncbi:uroporphyrinogen-III synthase [Luteimonas pelagia]